MSGTKQQIDGNKQDGSKIGDKFNDLGNRLSVGFKKINETLDEKLNSLETIISSKDTNESVLKQLNESISSQKLAIDYIKSTLITSPSNSSSTEILAALEKLSNSTLEKQLTSAMTILNSKLDSQTNNIDRLLYSTSKEELTATLSTLDEKLTNIEENQSVDVISILEKIGSLEQQTLINIEVNSELLKKIEPIEKYLVTLVKAVTTLYEKNNELKIMQKNSIDKIDGLTEMLTSLINTEAEAQSQPIEPIENKEVKVNIRTKLKTFLKSLSTSFLKWRTS
jgi:hypothetical protein